MRRGQPVQCAASRRRRLCDLLVCGWLDRRVLPPELNSLPHGHIKSVLSSRTGSLDYWRVLFCQHDAGCRWIVLPHRALGWLWRVSWGWGAGGRARHLLPGCNNRRERRLLSWIPRGRVWCACYYLVQLDYSTMSLSGISSLTAGRFMQACALERNVVPRCLSAHL